MSKADKLLKRIEFYEKMATSEKPQSDELLKKASFYERFALYSDRGSFLQALAQTPPGEGGVKASLEALVAAVQNWISTSAEKQEDIPGNQKGLPASVRNPFANVLNASKYKSLDLDMLDRVKYHVAELAAVNKNLRDASTDVRHSWINTVLPAATNTLSLIDKEIAELKEWRNNMPPDTTQDVGTGKLEVPEVIIPGKATPNASLPPINRADQQAVARLFENLVQTGDAAPTADTSKMNDGILGGETRKALEAIKDYYGKTYPTYDPKKGGKRMTDQQAIQAAKSPAASIK